MMKKRVETLIIVGPTASGKTKLAIEIALKHNAEIISADSRAVYRGLDIGTAKPSMAERSGIIHYGFDLIDSSEVYSALRFKEDTNQYVRQIKQKSKLPIIVGGTGLYIDSYLYDFRMPKPNYELREDLSRLSVNELVKIINNKGFKLPKNSKNKLHLIQAIERNGQEPKRGRQLPENYLIIGLNPKKDDIKRNIENRARQMINEGVIEETQAVIRQYGFDCPSLKGGIYKELIPYIKGSIPLEVVLDNFIKSDRSLVKRQLTWFKRNKDISWFDGSGEASQYLAENIILG